MASVDLHPATSIFVPLPTSTNHLSSTSSSTGTGGASSSTAAGAANTVPTPASPPTHYLVIKTTPHGIAHELIKLVRIQLGGGVGYKWGIGERVAVDLEMIRGRRRPTRRDMIKGEEKVGAADADAVLEKRESRFDLKGIDLKEMFLYCK